MSSEDARASWLIACFFVSPTGKRGSFFFFGSGDGAACGDRSSFFSYFFGQLSRDVVAGLSACGSGLFLGGARGAAAAGTGLACAGEAGV